MKYAILFILVFSFVTFLFVKNNNQDIVLELINGDQTSEVELSNGQDFSLYVPEKIGYTFDGWYNQKTDGIRYTDEDGSSINPANSDMPLIFYAHYKPISYSVFIDDVLIQDVSIIFDDLMPTLLPPISNPTGMEFIGYFSEISNTQITDHAGKPLENYQSINADNYENFKIEDGSLYLITNYTYKEFTINYFVDENIDMTKTKSYNDIIYNHYQPDKENYTFVDWYVDPSFETTVSKNLILDDDSYSINLYAKFLLSTPNVLSFTSINQDQEYLVSLDTDTLDEIVIPSTYFGKPVTKIGNFQNCQAESIILPKSINEIELGAFKNCTRLKQINLPDDITIIPEQAFMNANALQFIQLPKNLVTISDQAFAYTGIKSLNIPQNLINLSDDAFMSTHYLSTITIDKDQSLFEVSDGVLLQKKGPYRILVLYPSGKPLFRYEIPDHVTEINAYAFYEAQHLSEIIFNDDVHNIGNFAFYNLKQLTYIDLTLDINHPSFLMGESIFANNTSLKTMIINHEELLPIHANTLSNSTTILDIYVPTQLLNDYQTDEHWNMHQDIIHPKNLIFGQYILKEVTINDIEGYEIKYYLGDSMDIDIPEIINSKPILSIDNYAFAYKSQLESLEIPESIKEIKSFAFANCNNLIAVYLNPITPPTITNDTFLNINQNIYFYIMSPDLNVIQTYKTHVNWSTYADHIYSNNN